MGTDDFHFFSVPDNDVIPQELPERHMMTAVELELPPFQPLQLLPQHVCLLVLFNLFFCHCILQNKKSPSGFPERLLG
jgi:hypothetical protein